MIDDEASCVPQGHLSRPFAGKVVGFDLVPGTDVGNLVRLEPLPMSGARDLDRSSFTDEALDLAGPVWRKRTSLPFSK